jgi:hypothetical protein
MAMGAPVPAEMGAGMGAVSGIGDGVTVAVTGTMLLRLRMVDVVFKLLELLPYGGRHIPVPTGEEALECCWNAGVQGEDVGV